MSTVSNDVSKVTADTNKVVSEVKTDVTKVEADVTGFLSKTFSAKVLLVVGAVALVVGFVVGKL